MTILRMPPLRRLFYCLLIGAGVLAGARAVNAEPSDYRDLATAARTHRSAADTDLVRIAKRYLGRRNPTGFRGPWCKAFLNMVLEQGGYRTDRSLLARDAIRLGKRLSGPRIGAVAMRPHHVTIVAAIHERTISGLGGNQAGGRVALSTYPASGWTYIEPSRK